MPTTTRGALRYPVLADTPDVPRDIGNLASDVDALFVIFGQGLFSARPTSTAGSPGKSGRVYYATDTGHFYYDFGTGWTDIGPTAAGLAPNSVTSVELADLAVDTAAIQNTAVTNSKIAANAVQAAQIDTSLKPSAGAGAGTEALRSLGTAAGTAAPGTHASQHSRTGADPLVLSTFISSGTFAARPNTGLVGGMIYVATDQNGGTPYIYTGAAWIAAGGAATGTTPAAHATTHAPGGTDVLAWTTVHAFGTLASRPAASAALVGYLYFGTDTATVYVCQAGPSWIAVVAPASVTYAESVSTAGPVSQVASDTWYAFAGGGIDAAVTVPATATYDITFGCVQENGLNPNRQRRDRYGISINGAVPTTQMNFTCHRLSGANSITVRAALTSGQVLSAMGMTEVGMEEGGMSVSHRFIRLERVI